MMLAEKSSCKSKPIFNFLSESVPEAMIDGAQSGCHVPASSS